MKHGLCVLAVCVSACGGSPATPTPPAPTCQTQNTATLILENRSVTGRTLDVYLDNSRVGVLAPGQQTTGLIVAAGVKHDAVWYVTNTSLAVCLASPVPIQCSSQLYFCDF